MMPQSIRLLLLEDRAEDAELLVHALRQAELAPAWQRVETREEFLDALESVPDLILADYQVPGYDALQALADVQERGLDVPILVVSGAIDEETAVASLKAGAADYLLKDRLGRLGEAVRRAMADREVRREKRRAEAALRETSETLAATFRASPLATIVVDPDLIVRFWNPAAERIFGWPEQEIVGRPYPLLPAESQDERKQKLEHLRSGNSLTNVEAKRQRRDGTLIDVSLSAATICDESGNITGTAIIFADMTEWKRAQNDLRAAHQRLATTLDELRQTQRQIVQQERLRALGEMASGIAHDVNNALGVVIGFSELLLNDKGKLAPATARRYVDLIHASAVDASRVVGRLREFYRPRDRDEHHATLDLNGLVRQVVELTRPKWKDQAQLRGATIRVETELADIPAIRGNASEIREALTNLLFNAVDALSGAGTITVQTRVQAGQVLLCVTDNGAGMSDEVRQRCLEPFFSTKGEQGTGLGLSMVYGVATRHDARITIDSAPGRGTTVTLAFSASAAEEKATNTGPTGPVPAARRILVIDDEPQVREVIRNFLTIDGHQVVAVPNGPAGLAHFQSESFDLVITDRAMPEMRGDDVAAQVKALSPTTPVILISGFGDLMSTLDERPPDIDLLLGKPVRLADLREALSTLDTMSSDSVPVR